MGGHASDPLNWHKGQLSVVTYPEPNLGSSLCIYTSAPGVVHAPAIGIVTA